MWSASSESRERTPTDFLLPVDFRSVILSDRDRAWLRWIRGRLDGPGPRTVQGRRRIFVAESQEMLCQDPFGCCPLEGRPFPVDPQTGRTIFELDHIVPWSQQPNSSRPNLQALCPICHAMKTAREMGAH